MDDIEATIEVLKTKLLSQLGDEVDLIFLYGSNLKGNTHRYSDVDLSFVPVHDATWASITVMVEDRLFDFYPIHWPVLEKMADFENVSASVLLENRVIYRRTAEAEARFQALADRLRSMLQPAARPRMVRKSQDIFQQTAYPYYLLRQEVSEEAASRLMAPLNAGGHTLGCLQQAQVIFRTVLHSLAVCNQACIDTRKLAQVLALPKLPDGFAETARCVMSATQPAELLDAVETLLQTTRALLLSEERQCLRQGETLAGVFNSGYPELKRDIQAILLGCELQDPVEIRGSLVSLYHELSRGIALVNSGVEYGGFNRLSEYEQDFAALGFPPLLPALIAGDFDRLSQQCLAFDRRLREFLTEQSVALNDFADLKGLKKHLEDWSPSG